MTPPDRAALKQQIEQVLDESDLGAFSDKATPLLRDVLSLLSAEPERPETPCKSIKP